MARAIVAAAVHRPSYRLGKLSAEGPDEDEFTLAVAAAERLLARPSGPRPTIDGLHLVGEFPPEADAGLPEALGVPHVTVERHGSGIAGLGAALRAGGRSGSEGTALVLVVDRARAATGDRPASGAAAVALELRPGAGLVPTGHGGRRHPAHRSPDANGWVADAIRHSGLPETGASGTLYFVAKESPPVLLAFWRRAHPSMPVVPGSTSLPGVGPAPSVAPALWALELAAVADGGEWGVLARVTSEETQFVGFHRTGPIAPVDDPGGRESDPGLGPQPRPIPSDALRAVSEGAYVPRPRYVENLPSRWRLAAERCSACGALTFPMRGRCRGCGSTEGLVEEPLPRHGTVLAATVVAPGAHPTEFDPIVEVNGAYGVVLAELATNVRVTLQVADHGAEPLAPGHRVGTQLRRLYPMEGEWRYGRKAVADDPPASVG
jgi:hydroxymethylglutaryl-CoA synthase